ncbi:MAG TPA: hypothetical protein VK540_35630 [Polyangiaceae bacterium]|nr:hypothetical protein [Polyangiaceae bacterium]
MADRRLTAEEAAALSAALPHATPGRWTLWAIGGRSADGLYRYGLCVSGERHHCVGTAYGATDTEAKANATVMLLWRPLVEELEAVRGERDAALALVGRMSDAIRSIGVAALNWDSATRVSDVLDAVAAARKACEP